MSELTQAEYKNLKERIIKGGQLINAQGGFSKANPIMIERFQALTEQALEYEVEHDLIKELR